MWNPLRWAAYFGYGDICEILIKAGCDMESPCPINDDGLLGWTALALACETRKINTVNILLKHGCKLDFWNGRQNILVEKNCTQTHTEILQALYLEKQKRNQKNKQKNNNNHNNENEEKKEEKDENPKPNRHLSADTGTCALFCLNLLCVILFVCVCVCCNVSL